MAKRKVIWAKETQEELNRILEYYTERNASPSYSLKLLDNIEKWNELMEQFPYIGRVSENGYTRVVTVEYFLIFYNIGEEFLEVISFWDNRQNPEKRIDKNI